MGSKFLSSDQHTLGTGSPSSPVFGRERWSHWDVADIDVDMPSSHTMKVVMCFKLRVQYLFKTTCGCMV
jgi:hypothetical protein